MKPALRVTAILLASALFILSVKLFRRVPDPIFEGRSASAWVNDLLSPDYKTRSDAQAALQVLGEPGVPQLRLLLRKTSAPWEAHLAKLNRWLPFLDLKPSDAILCRQRAAEMVGLLGKSARAALPDLIGSLGIDACSADAERTLMRSGADALPALEKALANRDPNIRRRSVKLIGELRDFPASTATNVVRLATDTDPAVRRQTAHTLGMVEPSLQCFISPALFRLAADPNPEVRAAAVASLGRRDASPDVIETVRSRLADTAVLVRLEAAKALWNLNKDANTVVPVLMRILSTRESWQAAYALADLGDAAAPAVPTLIGALIREHVPRPYRTPPSSAFALGQIGAAAIPAIKPLLAAADPSTRLNAILAIGFMAGRGKSAVPELLPLLHDGEAEVRHTAALTLATIGAEPGQVLAGLADCLTAEDIYMRSAAAQILREIAPEQNWVVSPE